MTVHNQNSDIKSDSYFRSLVCHPVLISGIGVIITIGAILAVYYLCPIAHTWANHTFSQQISLKQSFLFIGVPAAGGIVLAGFLVCTIIKDKKRKQELYSVIEPFKELGNTIKSLFPSSKKAFLGQAGITAIVLVVLALNTYMLLHYNLLPGKLQLWQGLAYVGSGGVGVGLLLLFSNSSFKNFPKKHLKPPPLSSAYTDI